MTTYLSDDMEAFPTGWTTGSGGGGTITKSSTQKHAGSYSALVSSNANGSYAYAYQALAPGTGDYHMSFWVWIDPSVQNTVLPGQGVFETYDGTNVDVFTGIIYYAGAFYLTNRTGGVDSPIFTVGASAWHHLECYVSRVTGNLHYYLDGVYQGEYKCQTNATPTRCYFGDVSGTGTQANGIIYYDDLLIDDATEPVVSAVLMRDLKGVGL